MDVAELFGEVGTFMVLPRQRRAEMIRHAYEANPRECCGILVGRGHLVTEIFRAANVAPTPHRYELDPGDHIAIFRHAYDTGLQVLGIYHSHVVGSPQPSLTDIELAFYPELAYVLVGIAAEEPDVRAFRIVDRTVTGVELWS